MKKFYKLLVFFSLTTFSFLYSAQNGERHSPSLKKEDLFKTALKMLEGNYHYTLYSQALGDPAIAHKWIANLAQQTAHLNYEDSKELVEKSTEGFLIILKEINPRAITEGPNEVFSADSSLLPEPERIRLWKKHKNQLIKKREEENNEETEDDRIVPFASHKHSKS